MPKEIRALLKAANIKKRDLKNKDVVLKTFDIIQKAIANHTQGVMNTLIQKRLSMSESSVASMKSVNLGNSMFLRL